MTIKTSITLYTEGTPNGLKPTILLAELDLEYKLQKVDIHTNEHKQPWFLAINPNGRIPALTDMDDNGNEIRVFESGAILEYLATRYDKDHKVSYPYGSAEHWETTSWLMWQMAGVGPMQGQANHFARLAPEKMPYSLNRYVHETRRLYRTLDAHLAKSNSGFIVGDRVTVADIAIWPWVTAYKYSGLASIDEFPHVHKWLYALLERPGFEAGRNAPGPHAYLDMGSWSEEQMNERAAASAAWNQEAMKKDAEA